eukprot:scaffold3644_cov107-Isochrysis_galbana.AAC.12
MRSVCPILQLGNEVRARTVRPSSLAPLKLSTARMWPAWDGGRGECVPTSQPLPGRLGRTLSLGIFTSTISPHCAITVDTSPSDRPCGSPPTYTYAESE